MILNDFIVWAEQNGWQIEQSSEPAELPEVIADRYPAPAVWQEFIAPLRKCSNATDTVWFLTYPDYQQQEQGFQWNEFEKQSMEAAGGDHEQQAAVTAFWNYHLPIVLNVAGDYTYYAIDTQFGSVVCGTAPEYEEPHVAAESFPAFIRKIISGEITL